MRINKQHIWSATIGSEMPYILYENVPIQITNRTLYISDHSLVNRINHSLDNRLNNSLDNRIDHW